MVLKSFFYIDLRDHTSLIQTAVKAGLGMLAPLPWLHCGIVLQRLQGEASLNHGSSRPTPVIMGRVMSW